jgi:uncharacterized protein (TIGR00730 family)
MSDRTVVIFGSSATRPGETLYSEAEELGRLVALGGYRVYNGGYDGIMEASAKGAREMGGRTVGITTRTLKAYKRNLWIDEEIICDNYSDRMKVLFDNGDAFLALPGGVGTFSEVFLLWCLFAIGESPSKPFILIGKPWKNLLDLLATQFVFRQKEMKYLTLVDNVREAIQSLNVVFGSRKMDRS